MHTSEGRRHDKKKFVAGVMRPMRNDEFLDSHIQLFSTTPVLMPQPCDRLPFKSTGKRRINGGKLHLVVMCVPWASNPKLIRRLSSGLTIHTVSISLTEVETIDN